MGSSEYEGWLAFYAKDPWGPGRDNFHAALICSLIANALRGKGKKPISYQEFMLTDRDQHRRKKSSEFLGWLKAVAKPKKGNRGK